MLTLTFLRQSDPRWKSGRDCGALRGRRWSRPPDSGCPFPRAADWPHAKEWPPKRVPDKPRCTGGESCWTPLLLRRAWREFLEHFLHALIQVLDVLVGVVGERVAGRASPDQLLCLGIEDIDAGIHLGPAFCCQGGIDGSLDSIYV